MTYNAQYFRSLAVLVLAGGLLGCGLIEDKESPANSPLIERFVASPNPVSVGDPVVLRWDVSGAESVRIDPGVGIVTTTGSQEVLPGATTLYTLSADSGTTGATATIEVVVIGSSADPTPTPTPDAGATPTPTLEGAATPTPTPDGTATPTPTPTPVAPTPTPASGSSPDCGAAPSTAKSCGITVTDMAALSAGECLQVTQVAVSRGCPVGFGVTRAVSFRIQAVTKAGSLGWRRASSSADVLSPASGSIAPNGPTDVALEQTVLDQALVIEIVDSGRVLMRFSIAN
ncbi:MAG: hypothetical protein JXO72_09160 [Vicinamibacteria bacterium]|nr:hypothetical protein [Vicinamibacteria bacterium]